MTNAHRAWHLPATLRFRLSLALLATVALAVVVGTAAHLYEVSARLDSDLRAQARRIATAIETELAQSNASLGAEIDALSSGRGVGRMLGSGRIESRFFSAQERLLPGRIDVLKILGSDGTILTSGHWPASFGALDPLLQAYMQPSTSIIVVDEATSTGSSLALERWVRARTATRDIVIVAGRFLDAGALEAFRMRTGASLVALCTDGAGCVTAVGEELSVSAQGERLRPFSPDDAGWQSLLATDSIAVGQHRLVVGLDRAGIDRVQRGIVVRAVFVGLLSIVFAVIAAAILATRFVRPIESLAAAAQQLAGGDLTVRVAPAPQTGTEVKELIESFNSMAKDLERGQQRLVQTERVAAWQEIARGLAHELKNPLTPILSAMEVLKKAHRMQRPDFPAILDEQATAVIEEVMRLKELADAFARFARLPEQRPEDTSPAELLDHALALYVPEGIEVTRHYASGVRVHVDKTQMSTVLTNLVKNAVEAMETMQHQALDVHVNETTDDTGARFVLWMIDDSGAGIAADVADRLFTPYVTTKGSRGTGLGLALSHRIVVEHGGTIEAHRSPAGGARFVVRVPQAAISVRSG
jgi:two-component system, NtrC family, nitrogen regulation sensor histidine kinase NtrY